jgi:DnaJ-class molecular chaperone
LDELHIFKNLIQKNDWEYLEANYGSLFKSLNLKEIFNFFTQGTFPKRNINKTSNCSDSDINIWDETQAEYYYDLPIYYQKPCKLDIKINLNLTLSDLINQNKRKIKIKRNMEDEELNTTFIFNLNKPLVVFKEGGDMDDGDWGNLIIQLNLPKNFIWKDNLIYYEYPITLYQMVYGLDINLDIGTSNHIKYTNWVPSRDGLMVNIDKVKIKNHYFAIKFTLDYEDTEDKAEILKTFFN